MISSSNLFNRKNIVKVSKFIFGILPVIFFLIFYGLPLFSIFSRIFDPISLKFSLLELLSRAWQPLKFSLWQAILSTFFTAILGIPSAYVFARYKFPGKSIFRILTTVPFIMPTVVVAAGFVALIGPNGWLNILLMRLFGISNPPIAITNTLAAIILAHVFYNTTVFIRILGGSWSQLDRKLEYAAGSLGANRLNIFLNVTFPLLKPAFFSAFLLVFLFDFTSFAVILMLGGPGFATLEVEIYTQALHLLNLPLAGFLSAIQLMFTFFITSVYSWINQQKKIYLSPRNPNEIEEVPKKLLKKFYIFIDLLILNCFLVLPLFSLVFRSFFQVLSIGNANDHLSLKFTTQYYYQLFVNQRQSIFYVSPGSAIINSFWIGLTTVIFALLLGFLASKALINPSKITKIYDSILMLPLGTSAVTLGLGFLLVFNNPPFDIRNFPMLIPIAHTLVSLPFVVRILQPSISSLPPIYHQSAALLGASPWRIWRLIEFPLISRAFISAGIFAFTISLGEFGATTFLSRPDLPTIPIAIYRYLSQPGTLNYGQAMAMATILMILCAMSIFMVERFRLPGISDF